jgi:hypothetical protein
VFRTQRLRMVADNHPSKVQKRLIYDRGSRSQAVILANLVDVIHGRLSPDADFASLIVLDFRFLPMTLGTRVTSAKVSVLFVDIDSDPKFDPVIVKIEPDGVFSLADSITNIEIRSRSGTVERRTEHDSITVIGTKSEEGRTWGSPNSAWWIMDENSSQKSGIPYRLQTAILLTRRTNRRFKAIVKVEPSISESTFSGFLVRQISKFWKRKDVDVPVIFDPTQPPTDLNYDAKNLSGHGLKALGSIALPQSFIPTDPENGPLDPDSGSQTLASKQIREGSTTHQRLYDCSRGLYPHIWYQFKRFETLSLFNLYNYQHELVELQKKINGANGELEPADAHNLRALLREYCKPILCA